MPNKVTVKKSEKTDWVNRMKPDKRFIVGRLKDLDKTQTSLGKALSIDRAQVTRLLDGDRRVRLDEVETLARHLDISTIEMLRRLGLNL